MQAIRVHEGEVLAYETILDPEPKPRRGRARAPDGGAEPPRPVGPQGHLPVSTCARPRSDGAGARRDTGEDVVIYPGLAWADAKTLRRRTSRFWADGNGTYAELIAVPEENVFPKPSGFS